jgi:nucleoside transporter
MNTQNSSIKTRLCVMNFIQLFVWGAWFTTVGACLTVNKLGGEAGHAYNSAPLAAIFAPLFLGFIADRFFASEKVMSALFLIGGLVIAAVPYAAEHDPSLMRWLFLGHMLCYMPTLGLANTIAFSNIPDPSEYPSIRVWGTIGWIAAGLLNGAMGLSYSMNMFYIAAGTSLALSAFCLFLPHTPPPAKGAPINLRSLFMVDAFSLFKRVDFAVFMVCSTLICIPLAYYYGITGDFLTGLGFEQPAATMTIGQMSEIFFMVMMPIFFRRLGVKWMIIVGMLAWIGRYLLFSWGATAQAGIANSSLWAIFLAVALHGVCYDFFFVTGYIYTDKTAPAAIRSQAQSMLVFFTQGIGMYFGFSMAFPKMAESVSKHGALVEAIKGARSAEPLGFWEQFTKMFSVNLPQSVDQGLFGETMAQWNQFWIGPAVMAGVILAMFLIGFRPKEQSNQP